MSAAVNQDQVIDELTEEYAALIGEQPRHVRAAMAHMVEAYGEDKIRQSMREYCVMGSAIENEKFAERFGWKKEEGDES